MRNHLAVVMLSVLAGAAGGLAASFAARAGAGDAAGAGPAQLSAYAAALPATGSAVQEPIVVIRDALAERPEDAAAAALPADRISAEESMQFYSQGITAYIADDMVKAQASFENAVKADPTNVEAQIALRRINKEMPASIGKERL